MQHMVTERQWQHEETGKNNIYNFSLYFLCYDMLGTPLM